MEAFAVRGVRPGYYVLDRFADSFMEAVCDGPFPTETEARKSLREGGEENGDTGDIFVASVNLVPTEEATNDAS